jgi:murein DD-endopeptidase MepM/ murein hydrolase activator NlpD
MIVRIAIAAGTAIVIGGAAAGTGAAMHDAGQALSRIVADGAPGVSIGDGASHVAVVQAPSGTALLAIASGALRVESPGHVVITGSGDDGGLAVDYTGLDDNVPDGTVRRGDPVGHVLVAAHPVTVRAVLDGEQLDTASLLRAALNGVGGAEGGWVRPVDGASISQPFGCTPFAMEPVDRACPSGHIHTGIDLAAPPGTPVHAALDGVAHVVASTTGYGLHIVVDSGDGLTTLYGHLTSTAVSDGDTVAAGDVIGAVGSTGNSTGPHLHFEVRRDGIAEDPALDVALP